MTRIILLVVSLSFALAARAETPETYTSRPVFGVPIPMPASATAADADMLNYCTGTLATAERDTAQQGGRTHPEAARTCMAGRAVNACASFLLESSATPTPPHRLKGPAPSARVVAHASGLEVKWCKGAALTPAQSSTLARVTERWQQMNTGHK